MTTETLTRPEPPKVNLVSRPMGLFESLKTARRNLLEIIPEIALRQPMVSGKTGVRWHMVMAPDALRIVLRDRLDQYPKSDVTKRLLRPAIGKSLFIAEGAEWRWQRRAASPVFMIRNIDNLAPIMSAAAAASVARLESRVGGIADLYEEAVAMTIDVIANVTFSTGSAIDANMVSHAVSQYIDQMGKLSFLDMIGAPDWVPRPGRMIGPGSLRQIQQIAHDAIDLRNTNGAKEIPDLLDLLMAAEDADTGRSMSPDELRDNVLAFIVAGHETTALTIGWAMFLMAFDQGVQDRARAEAQAALQGKIAGAEHIGDLPYMRQIIQETLRLYPPAAILSRTAQAPDRLRDRDILPKDTVMLPIYALHRHQMLWDSPDTFDPDRFAPGNKIDKYAYIPFGNGPRVCIGTEFALREAQIVLATLISRFRFALSNAPAPAPHMLMTLRPKGGVRLAVEHAPQPD